MRTEQKNVSSITVAALVLLIASGRPVLAQDQAELAKKLQNPVANLISVPMQSNWDFGVGPADAMRYTLNVQPVIPFSLNTNWNLITRTIMPIIHAESPLKGGRDKSGLGDILQSFFFSPVEPLGGWILGGGPVFLYPSATDSALGAEKWGAGPTAVVLRQVSGWTYGMLANHVWSFAGTDHRQDVSATFLQPFVSYTTKTYTTLGVNTESSYDWKNEQWTMPFNVSVSQLLKIGPQPIQFTLGGRVRGAAKGAIAGSVKAEAKGQQYEAYDKLSDDVKQEYRQNEAKSAAAAGAAVGAAQQRQQRRQQSQAQQQQAAQANAAASAYNQAYKSCLMGRGYNVQ